jgi:hypothetical protein
VEHEAKALVRRKFGVDPDAHGRRGLVLAEARKLLGKWPKWLQDSSIGPQGSQCESRWR